MNTGGGGTDAGGDAVGGGDCDGGGDLGGGGEGKHLAGVAGGGAATGGGGDGQATRGTQRVRVRDRTAASATRQGGGNLTRRAGRCCRQRHRLDRVHHRRCPRHRSGDVGGRYHQCPRIGVTRYRDRGP